jgi:aspartate racemase
MLHIVDAAIEDALALAGPDAQIGLLATDATIASGLYINRMPLSTTEQSFQWLLPTANEMLEWVMPGVAAVKSGDIKKGTQLLLAAASALQQRGAKALVLGCTEIPVVLNERNSPVPSVDATLALARRTVQWSMAQRGLVSPTTKLT